MMLKFTLLLLCVGAVLCDTPGKGQGQQDKVDRGGKPEEKDFADLFKKEDDDEAAKPNSGQGQGQGQGQAQKSKATIRRLIIQKRLSDVFEGDTDTVTSEFLDVLSVDDVNNLIALKNLQCPNGTMVFDVNNLMLQEALKVAAILKPMTSVSPSGLFGFFSLQANQTGVVRFPAIVCWNDTTQNLSLRMKNFGDQAIKRAFHSKLLAHLTSEAAANLASVLPNATRGLLCERLLDADYTDMVTVTAEFTCDDVLVEEARNDSRLAKAILQGKKAKGLGKLSDQEWDDMMKNYGHAMPFDFIKQAPAQKIKERFSEIWDEDKADAIVEKVDFSTVNESFVQALGPEIACQLPTSSLLRIPTDKLLKGKQSLACLKKESNKGKRRALANKLLGARNATSCKQYLEDVDGTDARCWRMLTGADLQTINFTAIAPEELEELSCGTINNLRMKLSLGIVSNWTEEQVQKYSWMLNCVSADDLDDDDVSTLVNAIAKGKLKAAGLHLSRSAARRLFNATKSRLVDGQGHLNVSTLRTLGNTVEAMSTEEVTDLLTADVVNASLPDMQEEFSRMGRPARRALLNKLNLDRLRKRLCELRSSLAEDVDGEALANMTSLFDELFVADAQNCEFKCQGIEQCSAVFSNMVEKLMTPDGEWNMTVDFLDWARDSRVICGLTLEKVISLQPDLSLMNVAYAYFSAGCRNSKSSRTLFDKVKLFLELYEGNLTEADVDLLGGDFAKHMSADDLQAYSQTTRRSILRAMGKADLDDVSSKWVKDMAAAAIAELVATPELDSAAVLSLGDLICGVNANHVNRMTSAALTDALPKLSHCPDMSVGVLSAAVQAYKQKAGLMNSNMTAADLSLGGIAILSDCAGVDAIADGVKSDAVGDQIESYKMWKMMRQMRRHERRDEASDDEQTQNTTQSALRCTLKKMLDARARARQNQQARRKRNTVSFTCDDIRLLGEEASVLTAQDISAVSENDFSNCADVLGAVPDWTQEQKAALAVKAKQAWGTVNTWSSNSALLTAGSILQGLTAQELSSLSLTLQHVEAWGQVKGWSEEQLRAVFSKWLSSVSGGVPSITSTHLTQLGHFVCGATPTQVSQISTDAFRMAMSDVGDAAVQCSQETLQAWAAVSVQTLGPVTSWTVAQTAAVDRLLAGLSGSDLSKLSSSQLSVIDLETFSLISSTNFASLTVDQLQSLSIPQAMAISDDQLSKLSTAQKDALKVFGITISDNTSSHANVLAVSLGNLAVMATAVLVIILG